MTSNLQVQRMDINHNTASIQSQAQKIADLEEQLRISEEKRQQELQVLWNEIKSLKEEKEKTIEGQPQAESTAITSAKLTNKSQARLGLRMVG